MENNYLTIYDIQREELEILKIVSKYLKDNNIKYSIYYGTLLGSVRHNGFIPWDDDIDLAILRDDYDILINCLIRDKGIIDKKKGIEAEGFELGNSICPYIKIINKKIDIIDDFNYDKHLWIDMFPLDNVKDNNSLYFKKLDILRSIYFLKRDEINNLKPRNFKNSFFRFLVKPFSFNDFLKKYINYCKKYQSIKTNLISKNVWARKTVCQKSKFEVEEVDFCGFNVYRVKDYDYFLKVLYGNDYMKLPPIEKRVTHLFKAKYSKEKDGDEHGEKI